MDGKHFLSGLSLAPATTSTASLDFGFGAELAHPSGRHSHSAQRQQQQQQQVLAPTREALVEHNLRTSAEYGSDSGQLKVMEERFKSSRGGEETKVFFHFDRGIMRTCARDVCKWREQ